MHVTPSSKPQKWKEREKRAIQFAANNTTTKSLTVERRKRGAGILNEAGDCQLLVIAPLSLSFLSLSFFLSPKSQQQQQPPFQMGDRLQGSLLFSSHNNVNSRSSVPEWLLLRFKALGSSISLALMTFGSRKNWS